MVTTRAAPRWWRNGGTLGKMKMLSCARSAIAKVLLMVTSLAVTMLLLEGTLRLVTGDRYVDVELRLKQGPLVYEPNQRQQWRRDEWDIDYSINSRGFRDVEPPAVSAPSIIVLGDSFTEGYGVELRETYGKRLEQKLRAAGYRHHVYNAGIQGKAPRQYIRIYRDLLQDSPSGSLVIIGLCVVNDIDSLDVPEYVDVPDREAPSYEVRLFLTEHTALWNFLRRGLGLTDARSALLRLLGRGRPTPLDRSWASPNTVAQWQESGQLLQAFQEELRADGKDFLLVIIPAKEQVEDDYYRVVLANARSDPDSINRFAINEWFRDFAARAAIHLVDLTGVFRAVNSRNPRSLYFRRDDHWTAAAHEVAAEEILRYLQQDRLLREVSGR